MCPIPPRCVQERYTSFTTTPRRPYYIASYSSCKMYIMKKNILQLQNPPELYHDSTIIHWLQMFKLRIISPKQKWLQMIPLSGTRLPVFARLTFSIVYANQVLFKKHLGDRRDNGREILNVYVLVYRFFDNIGPSIRLC